MLKPMTHANVQCVSAKLFTLAAMCKGQEGSSYNTKFYVSTHKRRCVTNNTVTALSKTKGQKVVQVIKQLKPYNMGYLPNFIHFGTFFSPVALLLGKK